MEAYNHLGASSYLNDLNDPSAAAAAAAAHAVNLEYANAVATAQASVAKANPLNHHHGSYNHHHHNSHHAAGGAPGHPLSAQHHSTIVHGTQQHHHHNHSAAAAAAAAASQKVRAQQTQAISAAQQAAQAAEHQWALSSAAAAAQYGVGSSAHAAAAASHYAAYGQHGQHNHYGVGHGAQTTAANISFASQNHHSQQHNMLNHNQQVGHHNHQIQSSQQAQYHHQHVSGNHGNNHGNSHGNYNGTNFSSGPQTQSNVNQNLNESACESGAGGGGPLELDPAVLKQITESSLKQEKIFKEFLSKAYELGPTSDLERSMNEEKFARRESQQSAVTKDSKKPFGGYALQLLYLRFCEHAALKKQYPECDSQHLALKKQFPEIQQLVSAETGQATNGQKESENSTSTSSEAVPETPESLALAKSAEDLRQNVLHCFPWVQSGRVSRFLVETESATLAEGQMLHLARPSKLSGPSPYDQQYVIPTVNSSSTESNSNQNAAVPVTNLGTTVHEKALPITEKPVPAGYLTLNRQSNSSSKESGPVESTSQEVPADTKQSGQDASEQSAMPTMSSKNSSTGQVSLESSQSHKDNILRDGLSTGELYQRLLWHVENLGQNQQIDWNRGRDIVELEHSLLVGEEVPSAYVNTGIREKLKSMKGRELEGLLQRRTDAVGMQLVKRYSADPKLRFARHIYRLRNIGINPHDARLFRSAVIQNQNQTNSTTGHNISNGSIKSLVRFIKDEQTKKGAMVLRNQTRITTKRALRESNLHHSILPKDESDTHVTSDDTNSINSYNKFFKRHLFFCKLRILVSVHSAIEVSQIAQKWSALFDSQFGGEKIEWSKALLDAGLYTTVKQTKASNNSGSADINASSESESGAADTVIEVQVPATIEELTTTHQAESCITISVNSTNGSRYIEEAKDSVWQNGTNFELGKEGGFGLG